MRVLIADADPAIHETLTSRVASRGHEVIVCRDAGKACARFRAPLPSLVSADRSMPHQGGPLGVRLRQPPEADATVVIALTSRFSAAELEQVISAGADDYVTKPIDPDEF